MSVKASLRIQLTADSVLVAESEDPELWRRVFSAMQLGTADGFREVGEIDQDDLPEKKSSRKSGNTHIKPGIGIDGFATEVGVSAEDIEGACGPKSEAPFIQLDEHYWEALRSKTPVRGPSSISPFALAGTMLCVWFKHASISGSPTIEQCQSVLNTISLRDANAARSLRNCSWLQMRDRGVIINPAQRSKAIRLIKAYCLKKSPGEIEGAES